MQVDLTDGYKTVVGRSVGWSVTRHRMPVVLLVLADSPTLIFSLLHLSALYLLFVVLLLKRLTSGTLNITAQCVHLMLCCTFNME